MSKRLKALIVKELEKDFGGLDRCIIVGLSGIPAIEADRIRRQLASKQVRVQVVKNSLAGVALKQIGLSGLDTLLDGPSAIVTGGTDIVDLAKTTEQLAGAQKAVIVKGGFGEGKVLSPVDINTLSRLPGRQEQLAMLAGALSGALRDFAGMLGAVQRNFLYALDGLKEKAPA